MYNKIDSVPCGALEHTHLKGSDPAEGVAVASGEGALSSASTPAELCAALELKAQPSVGTPEPSPMSTILQEIERTDAMAFYGRVGRTTNLADRAFMLSLTHFKPYDKETRDLVRSVADQGVVGALVQHLMQAPQTMSQSTLKPIRLPRPKKLTPLRAPKSLYDTLLSKDDEAA